VTMTIKIESMRYFTKSNPNADLNPTTKPNLVTYPMCHTA